MFFRCIKINPFGIRQSDHQLEVYARPDGDELRRRADATVPVRRPPHLAGQASKTVCYGRELRLATPTTGNELGRQPWLPSAELITSCVGPFDREKSLAGQICQALDIRTPIASSGV